MARTYDFKLGDDDTLTVQYDLKATDWFEDKTGKGIALAALQGWGSKVCTWALLAGARRLDVTLARATDEDAYDLVQERLQKYIDAGGSLSAASRQMLDCLRYFGILETPGADLKPRPTAASS